MKKLLSFFAILHLCTPVFAEMLCPLKPDPPPAIDGNLSEWYMNAGIFPLKEENVTYGKAKWGGDPLFDIQPECFIWFPADSIARNSVRVASSKTENGYNLFKQKGL